MILEFTSQMTALDVVFIVIWVAAIVLGIASGVIRQLLLFGAIMLGIVLASAVAIPVTDVLNLMVHGPRGDLLPFVYSFLVVFLAALLNIATYYTHPGSFLSRHRFVDRAAGGIMGFIVGLFVVLELAAMLSIMTTSPWAIFDGARASIRLQLDSTPSLSLLADAFPFVQSIIQTLVP